MHGNGEGFLAFMASLVVLLVVIPCALLGAGIARERDRLRPWGLPTARRRSGLIAGAFGGCALSFAGLMTTIILGIAIHPALIPLGIFLGPVVLTVWFCQHSRQPGPTPYVPSYGPPAFAVPSSTGGWR
jgi:hypothetical protein